MSTTRTSDEFLRIVLVVIAALILFPMLMMVFVLPMMGITECNSFIQNHDWEPVEHPQQREQPAKPAQTKSHSSQHLLG